MTLKKWNRFLFLGLFVAVAFANTAISADEYNCGRIKDNWPPALPKSTGTTCLTGVMASSPQEAFTKCTTEAEPGRNCCVDNVIHKNIKGLAVIKGAEVTHIVCPGK